MILVDSNFFIALINEKDQYHKRAIELSEEIMDEDDKIVPLLMQYKKVSVHRIQEVVLSCECF